jgi:DNA polymerase-3 subunit epsilon
LFKQLRRKWLRERMSRQCTWEPMRQLLLSTPPDTSLSWRETELLALDLETTGLDAKQHSIVSMGWVIIRDGKIQMDQARHLIIQSGLPMNQSATIHGIFDSEIAQGIPIETALEELLGSCHGRALVFHHAPLDLAFLNEACKDVCGQKLLVPSIDTMALEKARLDRRDQPIKPGMLRLGAVRERYGLGQVRAHNALTDALATAELLLAIIAHSESGGTSLPLKRVLARH